MPFVKPSLYNITWGYENYSHLITRLTIFHVFNNFLPYLKLQASSANIVAPFRLGVLKKKSKNQPVKCEHLKFVFNLFEIGTTFACQGEVGAAYAVAITCVDNR